METENIKIQKMYTDTVLETKQLLQDVLHTDTSNKYVQVMCI